MNRIALSLLLLAGCSTPAVQSVDFVPAISVAVGVAEVSGGVQPDVTPKPSGECDNCGGTGKVGDGTVFVPCGACGGDGKIDSAPVETPLVEKLLPPVKVQAPKPTIADGQLSPRGEWRWSQAQGVWVPVAKPGPRWVENGHPATIDHLVRDHGYRRADLLKLTQHQLDTLHSNAHNSARARRVSAPTYSACPSGRCPRR